MAFMQMNLDGGREVVEAHQPQQNSIPIATASGLKRFDLTQESSVKHEAAVQYLAKIGQLFARFELEESRESYLPGRSTRAHDSTEVREAEVVRISAALSWSELIAEAALSGSEQVSKVELVRDLLDKRFKTYSELMKGSETAEGNSYAMNIISEKNRRLHWAAKQASDAARITIGVLPREMEEVAALRAYNLYTRTGNTEKAQEVKDRHNLNVL